MNVKELIERLQKLDPELRVVVRGYEGGVDDVNELVPGYLELNVNPEHYYGDHELHERKGKNRVPAIELK